LVSLHRKGESLFYGTVLLAVAVAGIFLFSKGENPVNFPIAIISFLGLFACAPFVSSRFKIDALKTPYKSIGFGILIVFLLTSVVYVGDAISLILKAYGMGAILVCYRLRREIKSLQLDKEINEDKISQLAKVRTPAVSGAHIVVQIVSILTIAVYSVVLRNFTTQMIDKIVTENQLTQTLDSPAETTAGSAITQRSNNINGATN